MALRVDRRVTSFAVIGNPENRRVAMFQAALAAQRLPAARVIAWRDLAEPGGAARLEIGDAIVRIESPGEDAALERALLRRGEAAVRETRASVLTAAELAAIPDERGRILAPRQHHLGFLAVLGELEAALGDSRLMQPIAAIRELFDKSVATPKWRALGIPVPESFAAATPDEVRAGMRERGWPAVYVKLTSGSSASCLAIFDGTAAITTVEDTGEARYNTRKLQRVTGPRLERLLAFLLDEGSVVERAIDKARLAGQHCDLRVLAIDGEPAFVVARTSPHPITNLHLGGVRGDVAALRATLAGGAWEAAMASCVAVQRASGAFHVGVDVAFEADLLHHRVLEGNAFGDLLPNLERDGLDVYGWEIRRYLR